MRAGISSKLQATSHVRVRQFRNDEDFRSAEPRCPSPDDGSVLGAAVLPAWAKRYPDLFVARMMDSPQSPVAGYVVSAAFTASGKVPISRDDRESQPRHYIGVGSHDNRTHAERRGETGNHPCRAGRRFTPTACWSASCFGDAASKEAAHKARIRSHGRTKYL